MYGSSNGVLVPMFHGTVCYGCQDTLHHRAMSPQLVPIFQGSINGVKINLSQSHVSLIGANIHKAQYKL